MKLPPFFTPTPNLMNPSVIVPNRLTHARQTTLRQIGQLGPFLEGSLSAFKRPGCSAPGWHLTYKQQGRTPTLYVPLELVAEVIQWTRNYRHLKRLIRQVPRHSRALIHGHRANRVIRNRRRQNYPLETHHLLWHHPAMLTETRNQFSLVRAAAKNRRCGQKQKLDRFSGNDAGLAPRLGELWL